MARRKSGSPARALGASDILLRDVAEDDLPIFFEHQLDSTANRMAAFTAKDPTDRAAFTAKWEKISSDDAVTLKTILFEGHVAGHIARGVVRDVEGDQAVGAGHRLDPGLDRQLLAQARVAPQDDASLRSPEVIEALSPPEAAESQGSAEGSR